MNIIGDGYIQLDDIIISWTYTGTHNIKITITPSDIRLKMPIESEIDLSVAILVAKAIADKVSVYTTLRGQIKQLIVDGIIFSYIVELKNSSKQVEHTVIIKSVDLQDMQDCQAEILAKIAVAVPENIFKISENIS